MIIVNAKAKTNSETIEALKNIINTLEIETKKERGCLEYAFSVDINNPNIVRITELWEDLKSLQDHLETKHVEIFRDALAQNPMDVEAHFYESKEIDYPG
jgi:quinol monooxygenase YgiN